MDRSEISIDHDVKPETKVAVEKWKNITGFGNKHIPWAFEKRNSFCIEPGNFYNHKSKTFLKNKRKGF